MKTVNERLIFLLNEVFKGNVSEFARVTGVPQPTLNNIVGNRMSKPSADNLERIINSIELLDANWLITGKGSMLKDGINTHINGAGNSVRNFSNVNVANNSSERITVGEDNSVPSNDNQKNEIEALRQTNKELLKEIEYLKSALTDKERLIQVLMNNLTNK